ncbi:hypothetical protein DBP19_19365 [Streptomyces sp. CS090A]|nr:hypothetical protein DBP19_19365 [Streptomyces sp. CS090A]
MPGAWGLGLGAWGLSFGRRASGAGRFALSGVRGRGPARGSGPGTRVSGCGLRGSSAFFNWRVGLGG